MPEAAPPSVDWSDRTNLLNATEELAQVGSWQWDVRLDRIEWSRQLYRILGYPLETTPTQALWFSRIHPEDMSRMREGRTFVMGEGLPRPTEFRLVRPDGDVRWVRMSAETTVLDGKAVYMRGIIVDITEQRHLECQLRQAQKMESLGRLAGGIAHDFNNILTVIRASLELLERKQDPRAIQAIEKATTLATELTSQLLTFSSPAPEKKELLDVNLAMKSSLTFVQRLLGERTGIRFLPGENVPRIFASQAQLERALMNLAANARDAMPPGGIVTIRTERGELSPSSPDEKNRLEAILTVEDTGTGMSETVRSRAFDPFFTTKRAGEGTGLGLAVVHGIVKGLGGRLELESEVGLGTKIRLHFPGELSEKATTLSPELKSPRRQLRLVLVDDNRELLGPVASGLVEAGHEVDTFSCTEEALAFFASNERRCEVLITDMMMGTTTGLELLESVRQLRPDLPAVLTSGYFSKWSGELPARTTLLPKPFSRDELLDAIVRAESLPNER